MNRIIPIVAILAISLSLFAVPVAADDYIEPNLKVSAGSFTDAQYNYEYFSVNFNGYSEYIAKRENGYTSYFTGNNFFLDSSDRNLTLTFYPFGLPEDNPTYVSLQSLRNNGIELCSVRLPIVMALANTGTVYSVDVETEILLYDSSFKIIDTVTIADTVDVRGENKWAFIDSGYIDIPYHPTTAFYSFNVRINTSVTQWIKVQWGMMEVLTRRAKSDEIISGSSGMQQEADKITGDISNKVDQGNQLMDALDSVQRPNVGGSVSLPSNITTGTATNFNTVVAHLWNNDLIYQMMSLAGMVMLASYILFGKKV